jgi:selenocysteine-specific elongation factor
LHRFALNRHLDRHQAQALWESCALVRVGDGAQAVGFSPAQWQALGARALQAAQAEHERAPDMVGVERDRLRRLTLAALERPVFDRLVANLLADGRLQALGSWLHLPAHRAELSASDADLWRTLQPLLEAAPCNPPRVRDIAAASGVSEGRVRELLQRVARVGAAYPVAHDHYFSAAAVGALAATVAAIAARAGVVRAADLRDAIGGGRKVAIHILEFFDRVGYTRRVRDAHCLRQGAGERSWTP